jgi:2-C-methyl-D-erythritol 4-phosphate cytidylyltransferase
MTVALIVAAGNGERLRAGMPKALVQLGGRPMVAWSIDAMLATSGVERIVVAMPPGGAASLGDAAPLGGVASLGCAAEGRITVVDGGASRSGSVRCALEAARRLVETGEHVPSAEQSVDDFVLVHDAARPLVTPALAESVIAALARDPQADAAIAALPVTDTVKRVDSGGAVRETLERSELWAVQTPQVFRRAALERALDVHPDELMRATDDAWLIERGGGRVIVVRASEENLKVTAPLDLGVAELLLAGRSSQDSGRALTPEVPPNPA